MYFHVLISEANGEPVLTDEHIRALCILTYSDNTELQRSAALCFTEISDRSKFYKMMCDWSFTMTGFYKVVCDWS